MPAKFRASRCTIKWHGTDDDTPPGHTTAIGTDAFGVPYLWLFKGDAATDEAFVGSISIPAVPDQSPLAYGRDGGYVGTVSNFRDTLARLAAAGDVFSGHFEHCYIREGQHCSCGRMPSL